MQDDPASPSAGDAPSWPVLLFEVDGFCQRVDAPHEVAHLYETAFWDEVVAAFDSRLRRVTASLTGGVVEMVVDAEPDAVMFEHWARTALARMWRISRFRVRRATAEEERSIGRLPASALWRELVRRTEAV